MDCTNDAARYRWRKIADRVPSAITVRMAEGDFEGWAADELARIQTGTAIRRPSDHQSMFKYVSLNSDISWEYLRRTLHDCEIIGSAAASLNDPFELSPVIFDDLNPRTIASATHYVKDSRFSNEPDPPIGVLFADVDPYRQRAESYLKDVAGRYRIAAFCERADSGLLWSHYANSYQGACLHFLAKGFHPSRLYTVGYVDYSKYRPVYPLSLALTLSSKTDGLMAAYNSSPLRRAESEKILFYTKADDWSYESEIRVVQDPRRQKSIRFHQDALVS